LVEEQESAELVFEQFAAAVVVVVVVVVAVAAVDAVVAAVVEVAAAAVAGFVVAAAVVDVVAAVAVVAAAAVVGALRQLPFPPSPQLRTFFGNSINITHVSIRLQKNLDLQIYAILKLTEI